LGLLSRNDLGDAEVEDLDEVRLVRSLLQYDVFGLDVSVDHPRIVGLAKRAAALLEDSSHPIGSDDVFLFQDVE
jgi:hypothetical protein